MLTRVTNGICISSNNNDIVYFQETVDNDPLLTLTIEIEVIHKLIIISISKYIIIKYGNNKYLQKKIWYNNFVI